MNKLPPLPVGIAPGSGYWNDWYEKLRTMINSLTADLGAFQATSEKNTANGYAGLNGVSRTTRGVDTTDDLIVDTTSKGLVLKSPNGHYWRAAISNTGVLTFTDVGTTKP